jgi:hypothetical protein
MDTAREEIKKYKFDQQIQDFYPESLQNSKLLPYINEHLSFKISDFNLVYHKTEEESLKLLKNCDFLKISEDTATYDEEQINCVFICEESLINDEILKEIKNLKDVNYNRLYKKNNYKWVFVPEVKNRETFSNYLKEKNIKMFNLKKSSIINSIIYYKESYDLKDRRKNSDYSNNGGNKWRKYSKNGYSGQHKGSHNSNYYNNNNYYHKGYKGRERFNSDGYNNNKNYNYYNYNSNEQNKSKKQTQTQIEVEIGEIKYPLTINHKYSINYLNNVYLKLKKENFFDKKPDYLVEENEIINTKPKDIEITSNINTSPSSPSPNKDKGTQAFENDNKEVENKTNLKMKIPKNNPLSQMKKAYNKFDAIPQNSILTK